MTIQIRKAERKKAKLRIGLSAPSGAGKTYSALLLAKGLVGSWDKVGLIDTENGRGDLYSDLGGEETYNVYSLTAPFTPERYIEVIKAMEQAGMEAIIIDSISHEWEGSGGCLESNENLANAKYKGNQWSAWNETTPRHRRFIEAIIASPAHIITTVRNKVDTIMTDGKIKKVGTKDITREGHEYEMTVNFNIDHGTHLATAGKDNTHLFDGKDPFVITEETGKKLKKWSDSGADPSSPPKPVNHLKSEIVKLCTELAITTLTTLSKKEDYEKFVKDNTSLDLKEENYPEIIKELKSKKEAQDFQADLTGDSSVKKRMLEGMKQTTKT